MRQEPDQSSNMFYCFRDHVHGSLNSEFGTGYGHIIRGASSPFDIAVIIMITGTPFINSVHQAVRPVPVNILAFHNPFDPVLFIPVDKYGKQVIPVGQYRFRTASDKNAGPGFFALLAPAAIIYR